VRSINRNIFSTELSGIKGFRSWFESQFPDAICGISSKGSQEHFDHVLIDVNQLLHIAVNPVNAFSVFHDIVGISSTNIT
jgi:XRN 5'-3' exonuclease N-terminus